MPDLVLHGRAVATVFDLLGHDENDMTYALGWGPSRAAQRFSAGSSVGWHPGSNLREPFSMGDRQMAELFTAWIGL